MNGRFKLFEPEPMTRPNVKDIWISMPSTFGWYFFTPKLDEYDLAQPIPVERVENAQGVYFRSNNLRIDASMGFWYGPINPEPPAWFHKTS